MKKIFSIVLVLLILNAALSSWSAVSKSSLSSSGAYGTYLAFLEKRLGDTSGIVLGNEEEAKEYGVDLSGFEKEGFVIRRIDKNSAIFAKSDEGLDRAVRYYAKHAAEGDFETVYGDGRPRVGRIILAGYDISEYVILIPSDASSVVRFAAENVRDYTKKACGVELTITSERGEHNIEFVEDETIHEQGFVIETTDGQMTVRHGWASGALNGAMTFLEKYEGWRFVYTATNKYLGDEGAIDYIYAADTVDIPAGISDAEEPALFSRDVYGGMFPNASGCWGYKIKYNGQGYGRVNRQDKACHGLSTRFWSGDHFDTLDELDAIAGKYPYCFTDEYNIELIQTAVFEYIDRCLAAGQRIGRELTCVDIANPDTGAYCECKKCMKLKTAEGANSALILNYANPIAKAVAEKYSPELYVSILAYFGTSKPPYSMRPEPNVHVSYCFYVDPQMTPEGSACGAHPYSGDGCESGKYNDASSKEFEKWCEIATIVDVWTYGDNYHPTSICNPFMLMLDNVRYIADCGAYGTFWLGTNSLNVALSQYVVLRAHWDPYITHGEMWDMVREYNTIVFGEDCGDYVTEIERIFDDAAREVPCYLSLRSNDATDKFSGKCYADNKETMTRLFDLALENAPTSALETQIKNMRCYYELGVLRTLWDEYSNGTEEQKAWLNEHYHILFDCAAATGWNGYSWDRGGGGVTGDWSFPPIDEMDFTLPPEVYVGN